MFERVINNLIQTSIDALSASAPLLERALTMRGAAAAEVDKLAAYWLDKGKPGVFHNYAMAAATLPSYAIVLAGENDADEYLDNSANATSIDDIAALIEEIQTEVGRTVDLLVRQVQLTYQVFTFAENPDVALAYDNVLRGILLGGAKTFAREGFERPRFSAMDLMPNQPYLPDKVYARMRQISGYAHVWTAVDFDLGAFATARGIKIEGIYVDNAVTGVDPHVTPTVK